MMPSVSTLMKRHKAIFNALQAEAESLQTRHATVETRIASLEQQVAALQGQLEASKTAHKVENRHLKQQIQDEKAERQRLVQDQLAAAGLTEYSRKKLKCIAGTGLHTLRLANKLGGILHLVRSYPPAKLGKQMPSAVLRSATVQGSKACTASHILQRQRRLQRRNRGTYKKVQQTK
jgi:regulator of replication initiation timing